MTVNLYSASVPVFDRGFGQLVAWLDKAEAHAAAKKFDPVVLLQARLAPDMLPLSSQVQIACDTAKFAVARIAGEEAPKFADDEKTLAELRDRIARTRDWIGTVAKERFDGADAREVTVPRRAGPMTMTAEGYLMRFVLPNYWFHLTTTYALLRHNGVELGKSDFLGPLP